MKRKDYEMPTMQVVELRQKCQILAGSGSVPVRQMNVTYDEEDI